MARITRFEELEAWQKARELTSAIYTVTATGEFSRDFGLRDQIRRASVSIMSNIAEGFERGGDVELRRYLTMAKGSAGEVKAQLYVALDVHFINQEQFDSLYHMTSEAENLIGGFMRYLRPASKKTP